MNWPSLRWPRQLRLGILAMALSAVVACTKNNPTVATDAAPDGPPMGCKAAPEKCTGATAVCDMAADTCVECTVASAAACVGVAPVCGVDNSCRGCTQNSECSSDLCLPSGACAVEGEVAYVAASGSGGTDNALCSKIMPCTTLTKAQGTGRGIVRVVGTVKELSVAYGSGSTVIFGMPNAKIEGTSGGSNLFQLTGTASLELVNLTIGGTGGTRPTNCAALVAGTPTLKITGGRVENCQAGLTASGGTVTVTGATVSGNTGGGITASGGTVTVTGATIISNAGGGIQLTGNGMYKLVNNFIVSNGNGTSAVGGVQIANVTQAGVFEFAFNTLYNNDVIPSAIAGISCQTVGVPLAFKNNIVFANKVSVGGTQVGGSVMCQHTYSDIGPDTVAGTGNLNVDPQFVNVAQTDVHLKSTSPVKDVADPAATLTTDIDGDSRPQGSGRDLGADEYKP